MSISRFVCACLVWIGMTLPLAAQNSSVAQTSATNSSATVQVPRLIRFSGNLSLAPAAPGGGIVNLTFSLYAEETGGTSLWQESQNVELDATGHYTVLLGTTQSEGLPIDLFTSGQAQWLGVRQAGEAEQARIMLVSVPFALKAGDAETFGGKPPSAYVTAPTLESRGGKTIEPVSPVATTTSSTATGSGAQGSKNATPAGSGTPNYIPLWTSSTNLGNSIMYQYGANIGIGTTAPNAPLVVENTTQSVAIGATTTVQKSAGVLGYNLGTTGTGFGVEGLSVSPNGVGLYGLNTAGNGLATGTVGSSLSSHGVGVFGEALSLTTTGDPVGVEGQAYAADGYGGVFLNNASSGEAVGLGGSSSSQTGIGIVGLSRGESGTSGKFSNISIGVLGSSIQTNGIGIVGTADDGQGVVGANEDPNLSAGSFTNYDTTATGAGIGVTGTTSSPNGTGVYGFVNTATAIGVTGDNNATSGLSNGVYGLAASSSGNGVYGLNTDTTGTGSGGAGMWGQTSSPNGFGVVGLNTAGGYGVYGSSATGVGILGVCTPTGSNICFNGIAGENTSTSGAVNGVWGLTASPEGSAVYMVNTAGGDLLFGTEKDGGDSTFYVQAAGSGYFAGNLDVAGAITAGTKDFKIDHPLDPANKYLVHASVESSEMMNIYTGNITTDGGGAATVQLPEWFEALNRDFRYQLTVMGQFAQAIVSDKVANHQFRIKTDKPNVEVSWQVTGVRHDAFANANRLQVEEEKALADRGHYLHPELFGATKEARISQHSGSGAGHKGPAMHPVKIEAARTQLRPQLPPPPKAPRPGKMPSLLPKTPPSPPTIPTLHTAASLPPPAAPAGKLGVSQK
jgi:hypothetical protein